MLRSRLFVSESPTRMRFPTSFALYSLLAGTGAGLPFRGSRSSNEEEVGMEGSAVHIKRRGSSTKRSAVVESFYADTDGYSQELRDTVREQAANLTDFLVDTRRTLHRTPELMYQEEFTSKTIQSVLTKLGVPFSTGWAKNIHKKHFEGAKGGHGIIADIGTGQEPCVLLRADMDALPILERTEIDFPSEQDNKMHACGHDAHTTMLLGAASILKQYEDSIPGTIRLMFQPAEEGGAGGKRRL